MVSSRDPNSKVLGDLKHDTKVTNWITWQISLSQELFGSPFAWIPFEFRWILSQVGNQMRLGILQIWSWIKNMQEKLLTLQPTISYKYTCRLFSFMCIIYRYMFFKLYIYQVYNLDSCINSNSTPHRIFYYCSSFQEWSPALTLRSVLTSLVSVLWLARVKVDGKYFPLEK